MASVEAGKVSVWRIAKHTREFAADDINGGGAAAVGGRAAVAVRVHVAEDFSQQNAHPNLFSASNGTLLPGDVIVAIDGTPCTAFTEAVQALRRHAADHAVLTIIREINKEYAS